MPLRAFVQNRLPLMGCRRRASRCRVHALRSGRPAPDGARRRIQQPDARRRGVAHLAAGGEHPHQEPRGEPRRQAAVPHQPGRHAHAAGPGLCAPRAPGAGPDRKPARRHAGVRQGHQGPPARLRQHHRAGRVLAAGAAPLPARPPGREHRPARAPEPRHRARRLRRADRHRHRGRAWCAPKTWRSFPTGATGWCWWCPGGHALAEAGQSRSRDTLDLDHIGLHEAARSTPSCARCATACTGRCGCASRSATSRPRAA